MEAKNGIVNVLVANLFGSCFDKALVLTINRHRQAQLFLETYLLLSIHSL